MKRNKQLILSILFIAVFFTMAALDREKNKELVKYGSITKAVVVSSIGSNYKYQYIVDGVCYSKKKSNLSHVKEGQIFNIYYDPKDPQSGTIDDSSPIIIDSVSAESPARDSASATLNL